MEICQTSNCDNSAIAICLHCNESLCVEHLLQHNEQLICEANMYCDEFNRLTEQIEHLSFDEQYRSAEEDLNDWLNEQLKELEKIYEEKLTGLQRTHNEIKENIKTFQDIQRKKIIEIRRLFNSKLNKQISLEQLKRMKTTVEQFRDDLKQFQYYHEKNFFFKQPIDRSIIPSKSFELNVHAKPFEYNLSSNRLFDEDILVQSTN